MSSAKGKLVRFLGGAFLRRAVLASADDVGGFRRLVLRTDVASPRAGTKLQVLLPSDDMRTYTPVASSEGVVLLAWKHGNGPGARWASDVQPGTEVRFVGPQPSLELPPGPVIIVGDETSVAVAASFEAERPGQVTTVFQATAVEETRAAAESVGIRPLAVERRGDTAATLSAVASAAALPRAVVALTGGSELVLAMRSALRARGITNLKTKTYWVPGKRGLD
jgi:NADPH-dependent ferric siderophore reductase